MGAGIGLVTQVEAVAERDSGRQRRRRRRTEVLEGGELSLIGRVEEDEMNLRI